MPIYAYKCGSCGHSLDVLQKMSDAPLSVCPACGAERLAKQLTAAGFQLKGSGWYATDFKGGASSAPAAEPGAEPVAGAAGASPAPEAASKSTDAGTPASPAAAPASTPAAPAKAGTPAPAASKEGARP